jgi:hypothetical protein
MINIEQIKSEIEKTHKDFLAKYSASLEKVFADQKLAMEISLVKIKYVLDALMEKSIVDGTDIEDISYATPNRVLRVYKKGILNYIQIITNGDKICIKGIDSLENLDLKSDVRIFNDVWQDEFDWLNFSKELLNFIHEYIYSRKKAFNVKIDGMFKEPK